MVNTITNKYKYILERLEALRKDEPALFNESTSPIIARWIQRSDDDINVLIGDQLLDESAIRNSLLPKMRKSFGGDFVFSDTPEGKGFWMGVMEDSSPTQSGDVYFNIYPTIDNSDSISKIEEKALLALRFIELNDSLDEKNSYSGELEGLTRKGIKNMLVNQALQGNQMDLSVFQKNKTASKDNGGFDWIPTPQGLAFWQQTLLEDISSDFMGMDISDFPTKSVVRFPTKSVVRESNPTTTTQINTKPADLVKEIEEGENRVEYFRDTKQDSLKEFAKDFPEAEAPLNKLLDLLSIKEEDRLNKSPKKKKKKVKKSKPVEEKTPDEKTPDEKSSSSVELIKFASGSWKGEEYYQAPLSEQLNEDLIDYDNIERVMYYVLKEGENGYLERKDERVYDFVGNRKDYNEKVLESFFYDANSGILGNTKYKVRIDYKDGDETQLTYDPYKFKLLGEALDELPPKEEDDLDALMQEVDAADACDLSLESLACELDELDDI